MISIITHSIHFNDVDFLFVCFCYQLIDWQFFWSCKNSDFFFASASIDISHAISWNSMALNGKLVINIVSVFIWSFGMNFQLKTQHLMWTMKSAFVHWNITNHNSQKITNKTTCKAVFKKLRLRRWRRRPWAFQKRTQPNHSTPQHIEILKAIAHNYKSLLLETGISYSCKIYSQWE